MRFQNAVWFSRCSGRIRNGKAELSERGSVSRLQIRLLKMDMVGSELPVSTISAFLQTHPHISSLQPLLYSCPELSWTMSLKINQGLAKMTRKIALLTVSEIRAPKQASYYESMWNVTRGRNHLRPRHDALEFACTCSMLEIMFWLVGVTYRSKYLTAGLALELLSKVRKCPHSNMYIPLDSRTNQHHKAE